MTRRLASSLCLCLALVGCPAPSDSDAGTDAGTSDAPERPDTPRSDAGRDAGSDAGRETDCTGADCTFVDVELAASSSCARRENGAVVCWGEGREGQLGDDRTRHVGSCPVPGDIPVDCSSVPVLVALDTPALELEASAAFVCAVTGTDRTHSCWGLRGYDIDTDMPTRVYAPVEVDLFAGTRLDEQGSRACWADAAGAAFCIGGNSTGQLGNGDRMTSLVPVAVTRDSDDLPLTGVLEIEGGTFSGTVCARTATEVYCWGNNDAGQLGDGITDHPDYDCGDATAAIDCSLRAVPATIDGSTILDLAAGFDHVCALIDDGTVSCWGGNGTGQLGTGDNAFRGVPTPVPGITDAVAIAANARNTCAVHADGTVSCWGQSNVGQVGDGEEFHETTTCSLGGSLVDCQLSPTTVVGLDDATDVSIGFGHVCAIRETGAIACWGNNDRFQLGDGTRDVRYAPVTVLGL
jgi:alpha-tubulin suppressor-like RCC1 family protein